MPYYMGDYYLGDPGFFSTLGSIAKSAVSFIPGVGPALSKGIEAVSASRAAAKAAKIGLPAAAGAASGGLAAGGIKGALSRVGGAALKHPVLTGAGAAGIGAAVGAIATSETQKLLRGGRMRKHRRMNPCNPRALRRALRRAHSFAMFAKKVVRVEHRFKKPRGRWPRGHSRKRK